MLEYLKITQKETYGKQFSTILTYKNVLKFWLACEKLSIEELR